MNGLDWTVKMSLIRLGGLKNAKIIPPGEVNARLKQIRDDHKKQQDAKKTPPKRQGVGSEEESSELPADGTSPPAEAEAPPAQRANDPDPAPESKAKAKRKAGALPSDALDVARVLALDEAA